MNCTSNVFVKDVLFPSARVSSRSRLPSFEEKHVKKLPCISRIVYWKHFSYIWRITETYVHKGTCLLGRNREICIAVAIHIHSITPNATRALSIPVIVNIASDQQGYDRCCKCAQTLRNEVGYLMFGEMYLQRRVFCWWFNGLLEWRWIIQRIGLLYDSWLGILEAVG